MGARGGRCGGPLQRRPRTGFGRRRGAGSAIGTRLRGSAIGRADPGHPVARHPVPIRPARPVATARARDRRGAGRHRHPRRESTRTTDRAGQSRLHADHRLRTGRITRAGTRDARGSRERAGAPRRDRPVARRGPPGRGDHPPLPAGWNAVRRPSGACPDPRPDHRGDRLRRNHRRRHRRGGDRAAIAEGRPDGRGRAARGRSGPRPQQRDDGDRHGRRTGQDRSRGRGPVGGRREARSSTGALA